MDSPDKAALMFLTKSIKKKVDTKKKQETPIN